MPLTVNVQRDILNKMKTYFDKLYLMNDLGAVINAGELIGSHVGKIRGGNKDILWGAASTAGFVSTVATTNNTETSPFLYAFVAATTFHRLILTDDNATEANRVVHGIIDIPSLQLPSFVVDGAYYIRGMTVDITEV